MTLCLLRLTCFEAKPISKKIVGVDSLVSLHMYRNFQNKDCLKGDVKSDRRDVGICKVLCNATNYSFANEEDEIFLKMSTSNMCAPLFTVKNTTFRPNGEHILMFNHLFLEICVIVAFIRNLIKGAHEFSGEYLISAQGEDVFGSVRTSEPIQELSYDMPEAYKQFVEVCKIYDFKEKNIQIPEIK